MGVTEAGEEEEEGDGGSFASSVAAHRHRLLPELMGDERDLRWKSNNHRWRTPGFHLRLHSLSTEHRRGWSPLYLLPPMTLAKSVSAMILIHLCFAGVPDVARSDTEGKGGRTASLSFSFGQYNFEGNLDFIKFIKIVQDAGLYVVLRIGPYVCAEWNYG
ncbi:hypothetical protein B296_00031003 [Ensete ventricosum]|uniref:beta-galactosidase n=1 Tax=Ensete ventricosum TaxID=4639 RepID=A0A426ZDL4_ENSVE|nr:hypothetical protein B296_00031003 [Ensete ventricosum]